MLAPRRPGLSMISLLFLLGLLVLLFGMLVPVINQLGRVAKRTEGFNNIRQLTIACHAYHDVHGALPPLVGTDKTTKGTLHLHILPYIEQERLYQEGREDWTLVMDRPIAVYTDSADPTAPPGHVFDNKLATTNYAGNWKVFRDGGTSLVRIADGTSNTLMYATRYQVCNDDPSAWAYNRLHYWAPMFGFYSHARFQIAPGQGDCDSSLPQSLGKEGIAVGMCDGSARLVSDRCSPLTWLFATDPNDGHALGEDFN
ncbi:MAG: DUF1559 domain-containing protein [Gemmataceae bacterium]